jgi:hypothetical protein
LTVSHKEKQDTKTKEKKKDDTEEEKFGLWDTKKNRKK